MNQRFGVLARVGFLVLAVAVVHWLAPFELISRTASAGPGAGTDHRPFVVHPVIGSWFGKAQQVCPTGADPLVNCVGLGPALALFMTPTLTGTGAFLGNDTFALGGAPLGPHTTAHGSWRPLRGPAFRADYVFMLPTYGGPPAFPVVPNSVTALRFRWAGQVVDAATATGTVNIYFVPAIPIQWVAPGGSEFPEFPPEADGAVTAPEQMILHPDECLGGPCPLIFKFTIKRVAG